MPNRPEQRRVEHQQQNEQLADLTRERDHWKGEAKRYERLYRQALHAYVEQRRRGGSDLGPGW